MKIQTKIEHIQNRLKEQKIEGWLLYDNHGSNRFVKEILGIPEHLVLTRRIFYWIPQIGNPVKIVHHIEAENLDFLPGTTKLYLSWTELEKILANLLTGIKNVAMEYSPRNSNPYVSAVDAGTIDVIRELGVDVVSSADLLQYFTSVLDEEQITSHLEAASVLQTTLTKAWDLIADRLRLRKRITEYDVQNFILSEFAAQSCITDDGPICAVNEHTALPHYIATKYNAREIVPGDFILIDMWCRKDLPRSVYADITRVAVAAPHPTPRQEEIFKIVRTAQIKATEFVKDKIQSHHKVTGADVDDICRTYIQEMGYGKNFPHRTGHNIDTRVHGAGVHLDNLETSDHRRMLPGMCFSIEPGIYLPNEFGVRIEYNILIGLDGTVQVTGGVQESILPLL